MFFIDSFTQTRHLKMETLWTKSFLSIGSKWQTSSAFSVFSVQNMDQPWENLHIFPNLTSFTSHDMLHSVYHVPCSSWRSLMVCSAKCRNLLAFSLHYLLIFSFTFFFHSTKFLQKFIILTNLKVFFQWKLITLYHKV